MLPLRALNFIWRRMGISANKFPLDIISFVSLLFIYIYISYFISINYLTTAKIWARGIIRMTGAKTVTKTSNKIPVDEPTIMLYNHGSFYDPIALGAYAPITAKYVFKKELIYLFPFIFLAALVLGHIPINRGKRDSAISALQQAAKQVKKLKRTIVIAPEGTRSQDGELMPFKKGPFHLALDSGVKHVVPVVLHNANALWPPGQYLPLPGTIWIHYMDPIPTKDETVDSLSDKVREAMEKEIGEIKSKKLSTKMSPLGNAEPAIAIILFCSVVGYYLYNWYFATNIIL